MPSKNTKGFSLVELMTVIGVIAIIALFVAPDFMSWGPGMRLTGTARNLFSDMQQARILAVKENRNVSVRFDTSTTPGFYYYDDNNDGSHTDDLNGDGVKDDQEYRVELSDQSDVDYGTGNATKNWNDAAIVQATVLTFTPQGTANSGTVYLSNMTSPEKCYAITTQISGSIKMRKYSGVTPFDKNEWK